MVIVRIFTVSCPAIFLCVSSSSSWGGGGGRAWSCCHFVRWFFGCLRWAINFFGKLCQIPSAPPLVDTYWPVPYSKAEMFTNVYKKQQQLSCLMSVNFAEYVKQILVHFVKIFAQIQQDKCWRRFLQKRLYILKAKATNGLLSCRSLSANSILWYQVSHQIANIRVNNQDVVEYKTRRNR